MPRMNVQHSLGGSHHRHAQSVAWDSHISGGSIPAMRPGTAPAGRPQSGAPEVVKVAKWHDLLSRDLERALARAERRRLYAFPQQNLDDDMSTSI